jgi:hypothetical protein
MDGQAVADQRPGKHIRVAGRLGGIDQTVRGRHRLVMGTGDRQPDDQVRRGIRVGVQTACELSATTSNPPFRLADSNVGSAKDACAAAWDVVASIADRPLGGLGVANSRIDASGHVAIRRHHIQGREPRVVDGACRLDELFGPADRFAILGQKADPRRICCDWGGDIQIALVGSPAECGAQIGQLDGEPVVGRTLAGAVPQGHDVGFSPGVVAGMRGAHLRRRTAGGELFLGELADRLQHRKAGPPRGPVGDQQRLAHQRIEQIEDGEVVCLWGIWESGYRACTLEVESAGEHRTSLQQRLLRVFQVVEGPRHRMAQRLMAFQSAA